MSTEVPTREIHQLRPRVAVATRQPQPPTQVVAVPKNCAFTTSASGCLKTIRFREQETKPSVSRVPANVLPAFLLVGPASETYTTARSDMNPSSEVQCRTRSAISTCFVHQSQTSTNSSFTRCTSRQVSHSAEARSLLCTSAQQYLDIVFKV